jgi:hypothetical protein
VDGLTWRTYEADLDRNLTDLHSRSIPGTAIAPDVYTKGRWETAPTGGGGARGQDCSESDRRRAELHL